LIAAGLSMDAFAVSLSKGLSMPRMRWKHAVIIALFFGGFQAGMPLLGWLISRRFEAYVVAFDHWVAFALLSFIGGKMIWEAAHGDAEEEEGGSSLNMKGLLVLAIATSIDALAVGITFAFLNVSVLPSVGLIGMITFLLSLAGVAIGHRFGAKFMKKAEIGGGVMLVLIGAEILLEHLGIF